MTQNNSLSTELSQNIDLLHRLLPLGKSFDLITRDLRLGETPAFWLGINGFCNTEILQQIFSDLQDPHYTLDSEIRDLPGYVQSRLGYAQVSLTSSVDDILQNLLSGPSILLVNGFDQAVNGRPVAEEDRKFALAIYTHGITGIFLDWVSAGMRSDTVFLEDNLARLFQNSLAGIAERCVAQQAGANN